MEPIKIADATDLKAYSEAESGFTAYNGRADKTFGAYIKEDGEWEFWQNYGGEEEIFDSFDEMIARVDPAFPVYIA